MSGILTSFKSFPSDNILDYSEYKTSQGEVFMISKKITNIISD